MMKKKMCLMAIVCLAWSSMAWSQTGRQLTIGQMFELIEQNNTLLRERQAAEQAAEMGVEAARSQRLPDIGASLSASYIGNALITDRDFKNAHGLSSPHFGNNFALEAQQVVYAGGAITAGIRQAELGHQQAQLSTQLSRQGRRFVALGQYLELQKLGHREQVIESNIELTQKLIDDIKAKQEQGVALRNDVTRYELQMQTLRLNLTKLRNSRQIINHQLCNTLGLPADETITPAEDVTQKQFARDGEGLWQQAAQSSPVLQMADVNTQMARQQEKLVRSEMLPKVALVANNTFNGPITFELPPLDNNLNIWYVGVGVQYSISSLFKSNKKLKQARLATTQAEQARAVEQENVNNQMQQAYTDYLQSYVELETQQKDVELARQNYQVINDRYLNQLALITDMLDASNMKLDAELSEVDAQINIAYAYYKLLYIAGKL